VTLEFYYFKTFYTTADSARALRYKILILEKEETVSLASVMMITAEDDPIMCTIGF